MTPPLGEMQNYKNIETHYACVEKVRSVVRVRSSYFLSFTIGGAVSRKLTAFNMEYGLWILDSHFQV